MSNCYGARTSGRSPCPAGGETPRVADSSAAGAGRFSHNSVPPSKQNRLGKHRLRLRLVTSQGSPYPSRSQTQAQASYVAGFPAPLPLRLVHLAPASASIPTISSAPCQLLADSRIGTDAKQLKKLVACAPLRRCGPLRLDEQAAPLSIS